MLVKVSDELCCIIDVILGLEIGNELVGDTVMEVGIADGFVGVTVEIEGDGLNIEDADMDASVRDELSDLKPKFIFV